MVHSSLASNLVGLTTAYALKGKNQKLLHQEQKYDRSGMTV